MTTTIDTATITATTRRPSHDDYHCLLSSISASFNLGVASGGPLFTTDAADLWPQFIASLPEEERQPHTCNACRRFVERFGNLVTIDDSGVTKSAMFRSEDCWLGIYAKAVTILCGLVESARVTGVFISSDAVYGEPLTKDPKRDTSWLHMAVAPPVDRVYRSNGLTHAAQAMAEKHEEYGMLQRALAEFKPDVVTQARAIVDAEALYRGEKVLAPLAWFGALHETRSRLRGAQRDNAIWSAVATAPAGWCHIRSSMVGSLLEDVAAGLDSEVVKRKFAEKMHPLQYRRPTAAPSDGQIAQAEKIVATLQTAGSLRRRFARLDDIQHMLWTPAPAAAPANSGGMFAHLKSPPATVIGKSPIKAPPITWTKFQRTVLDDAVSIEIEVPTGDGPFITLVTAADPSSPPILQWDHEGHRNPVSWYYTQFSVAGHWNLTAGTRAKVTAVTHLPFMWPGSTNHSNHGEGVIFIAEGAKAMRDTGSALFPECLRSEYHGISKVIERYSRDATIEGREQASACGLAISKSGGKMPIGVRVTAKSGAVTDYTIDRWD